MGCQTRFTCSSCAYTCLVSGSGDIDYGMMSAQITLSCQTCRQVADAAVEVPEGRMYDLTRAELTVLPPCAVCGSTAARVWKRGNRCPQCRGRMVADPNDCVMWD
jgi:tRNA(Ile2) C34 agmatinyltransferase TiaS